MGKSEQLRETLNRLSVKQATALARAVELQRTLGQETVPTDLVLEGVRPKLRDARPQRIPTICRLVCTGFEEFISDRQDEPRIEGLIPRQAIKHWWSAVLHVAGKEVASLEQRLKSLLAVKPPASLDAITEEVREAACGWAAKIVAELGKPKPDPALRKLLPGACADDARAIARVLPLATAIAASVSALTRLLLRLDLMDGRRITDLPPAGITLLKQHYTTLSESHGLDARFLALAVMNRLVRHSQILRLGRALSGTSNENLVANTEFASVGARVIGDVQRLARQIVNLTAARAKMPDAETLAQHVVQYMDESEALVSEFGFRRGSAWGDAILRTRADLASSLDRDYLEHYAATMLEVLPQSEDGRPDPAAAPARETIAKAFAAARLLELLSQRGQRHGFAQAARETLNAFSVGIDQRAATLLKILARDPAHRETIKAQISAAAGLCDEVLDDGRGNLLLRRLNSALRPRAEEEGEIGLPAITNPPRYRH